jgi:hypothetical protein
MRNLFYKLILAITAMVALAVNIPAQNGGNSRAAMPFAPGETLTYEGKISKIIRGIAVADLTFTLSQPPTGGDFVVTAEARSKGTLVKLFRFSFLQEIESTFGSHSPQIKLTKKHDVQKERVRDSEAVFDYQERRVTYTETDPKEPMRPPRRIASEIVPETHDIVSAIYRLRMLPLTAGASYEFTVSDSGLVYKVPVKITGREIQKTVLGRVQCLRIEPDIFGPGRLIEREGSMIIWMTDDNRLVPVRAQVNSPFGRIEIKLKSAKGLKS